MEKPAYYHIKSLEKARNILELLAASGELSVSEIGKKLGMHRSPTHRFLATLRSLGLLEQSEDARYRLSFKLFEWGMTVANRMEVKQIVHPFLMDLKARHEETTNLGIMDGSYVIYTDKIESSHLLRMDLAIGCHVPCHCTALGKAILANRPETDVRRLFRKNKFERRTPRTIASFSGLLEQLAEIRKKGYSIDDEELALGIRCIAVPIFNYTGDCVAAISIAGPSLRMTVKKMEEIKPDIMAVGKAISMRLGLKGE
jgi:IclR family acetate operon transcriptional repressor